MEYRDRQKLIMAVTTLMVGILMPVTLLPIWSRNGSTSPWVISTVVLVVLIMVVLSLAIWVLEMSQLQSGVRQVVVTIPLFLYYSLISILFLTIFGGLILFLLFPETIPLPPPVLEPSAEPGKAEGIPKAREVQIVGCICFSGLLGGFVHQLHLNLMPLLRSNDEGHSIHSMSWRLVFSLFSSLFLSLVFFLLLRAGLLKTVDIDTFNVYGVTGVAAVTGYFAENIISRIKGLYEQLLGPQTQAAEPKQP